MLFDDFLVLIAFVSCSQDSGRSAGSLSRDLTLSRVVFSCMQTVASTPVHKAVKKPQCQTGGARNTSKSSRFQQFHEVKERIVIVSVFTDARLALVIAACGWQLILMVVLCSRWLSRSNRMNLYDRVSSAALQHGTTQP